MESRGSLFTRVLSYTDRLGSDGDNVTLRSGSTRLNVVGDQVSVLEVPRSRIPTETSPRVFLPQEG